MKDVVATPFDPVISIACINLVMERFVKKMHRNYQKKWDDFERERIKLHPSNTRGFDLMDEDK